ncbi:MAG TPA: hypothetical protein VNM68_01960 [Candidatus Polarisedimenticolia bacterium]|nr:hypothetical protein [Candidatus Polarisedimenticolia bacterium]
MQPEEKLASVPLGVFSLLCATGEQTGPAERNRNPVSSEAEVASLLAQQTCVEKLAQLFPGASPVRIQVRVSTLAAGRRRLQEQTVIEFGTPREVLFSSNLPLEFEDRVRLVNSDGSLDARATVVAVRYHNGRKAVAARFVGEVGNWIIKP